MTLAIPLRLWRLRRQAVQGVKQNWQVERFLQEHIDPLCVGACLFRSRGHDDDRKIRLKGSEMQERFPAVFTARVQIKEDDVDLALPNFAQGLVTVRSGNDVIILHGEGLAECLAHHQVFVDQQDACLSSHLCQRVIYSGRTGGVRRELETGQTALAEHSQQVCQRE